jgi:hypothetical protein
MGTHSLRAPLLLLFLLLSVEATQNLLPGKREIAQQVSSAKSLGKEIKKPKIHQTSRKSIPFHAFMQILEQVPTPTRLEKMALV